MKKQLLFVSIIALSALSGCCCWRKKSCQPTSCTEQTCAQEEAVVLKKQARTSGPMQKEIGWDKADYQ